MTGITLANCDGQLWVVGGEEHLDDLLFNQLPPGVTVEVVPCAGGPALHALWAALTPDRSGTEMAPWALNPAITRRLLGQLGLASGLLRFPPWSAMLDDVARGEIVAVAAWAARNPQGRLVLQQFAATPAVPGMADLQKVRAQLVAAALAEAGVTPDRIGGETTAAAEAADSERLRIVMEPVTA